MKRWLKGRAIDWPNDAISIVLGAVFGAAIGLEREVCGKAAWLRTNVLIWLGGAVFSVISKQIGST